VYLVDTNIFLEVMLSRSKKGECKGFLELLRSGKESGTITDFSVHSLILVMENFKKKKELKTFLLSLTAYEGLFVYNTNLQDEIKAIYISDEKGLDMDDAIQYSAAVALGVEGIVSFDKHFDGLEIPRIEPSI
jgi:predicted nucleic acid-binding protein